MKEKRISIISSKSSAVVMGLVLTSIGSATWAFGGEKFTSAPPPSQYVPHADYPCGGSNAISPDSSGNMSFSFSGDNNSQYEFQFSSDHGSHWSDPLNLGTNSTGLVQVSLNRLLASSKTWQWRVHYIWLYPENSNTSDYQSIYSNVCTFVIKPAATSTLPAPILKSPICDTRVVSGPVQFDLDNPNGDFKDFKVELQYRTGVITLQYRTGVITDQWTGSNFISEIDKSNAETAYGVVIPVQQLLSKSGASGYWRWRARLYNEHMPIFANFTSAPMSRWCVFQVGEQFKTNPTRHLLPKSGGTIHQLNPQPLPPGMTVRHPSSPMNLLPKSGGTIHQLNPQPLPPG